MTIESKSNSTSVVNWRIIGPDGKLNLKIPRRLERSKDLYHWLQSLSWTQFFGMLFASFLAINLTFSIFYFLTCAFETPMGIEGFSESVLKLGSFRLFLECFFFSIQTFGTIGYGKIAPVSLSANILVAIEAFTGILSMAVASGLMYGRFSRPIAKILFSNSCVIQEMDGIPCLMFRIANERFNMVAEASIEVCLMRNEATKEGKTFRNFVRMKVEQDNNPIFALSWSIVHEMDASSPLFGKTIDDLVSERAEILVNFRGVDEILSQTIYARKSYIPQDLKFNHDFVDIIQRTENGSLVLHFDRIHETKSK